MALVPVYLPVGVGVVSYPDARGADQRSKGLVEAVIHRANTFTSVQGNKLK